MHHIFNIKQNRYNINEWLKFKNIAKKAGATGIKTGKSKFMYYIKVYTNKPIWKDILAQGTNFDYVPGGASSNVKWNNITVRL